MSKTNQAIVSAIAYPRPDFYRPNLNWKSLNGQWDFLFDDEDVGLSDRWFRSGLPARVMRSAGSSGHDDDRVQEAEKSAQQIGVRPEALEANSPFARDSGATVQLKQKINVPFAFQTSASGINDRKAHEVFWYELHFQPDFDQSPSKRLLVRFGAVDYEATVWLNGQFVGAHRGGHVPFDIDVTDAMESNADAQRLTIRVRDSPHDLAQPRGKQYWAPEPGGIFYTPSSGIWQSVWIESVPAARIADSSHGTIIRADNIESGIIQAKIAILGKRATQKYTVEIIADLDGIVVGAVTKDVFDTTYVNFEVDLHLTDHHAKSITPQMRETPPYNRLIDGLALWSPEYPNVYGLSVLLKDEQEAPIDEVRTYVGLRSLEWGSQDGTFRLNDKPYFQALVLDQGYWPETGITAPSADELMKDIELAKAMGFNGCRKHQKVEDPVFLYLADRLGYIVWGEMANGYRFDDEYVDRFNQEWTEAVKRDLNHPCIFAWTPVNESWGYPSLKDSVEQRNHIRSLYYLTKTLDPTRPVCDNDGWEHVLTDLFTFHDYGQAQRLQEACASIETILNGKRGRKPFLDPIGDSKILDHGSQPPVGAPVLCTEFGGINIAPAKDAVKGSKDWGYVTASDSEDLLKRIGALMEAIVKGRICCGFVYTQWTDIEQEVNGLCTFDRKPKLEAAEIKAIVDRARRIYDESVTELD